MSIKVEIRFKTILFLSLFFNISVIHATTYYISNNGNDNNDGLSIASTWLTIDRVNDAMGSFIAGDQILFNRGDIWTGERLVIESIAGTTANPIIFSAYGNGSLPIFTAMEVQPHSWTNIGGNIWQADNPPNEHPERLLKDDIELLRANIQADLNGNVFFWRYDNATGDLYIHSVTDPNLAEIKYATNFPLIMENTSYINVQNIDLQGGWTSIFVFSGCHHITFSDLNIGKYAQNGLISNTDASVPTNYPQDILIANCTFDAFFAFDYSTSSIYPDNSEIGVGDGFRPEALLNSEIKNCYFKNWGHASIDLNGVPANGTDVRVLNISVHDNYLTSPDITYGGRLGVDDSDYCEVFRNQIVNTSVQSQLNGRHNHYHHNIFRGTKNTPLIPDIVDAGIQLQGYSNTTVDHNIYEHNLILNCEGIGLSISGNNDYDIHDNIFRNNIIYNCGTTIGGKGIEVEIDEFEQTFDNSFQNNLVYSPLTMFAFVFRGNLMDLIGFHAATGTDGYLMENNLFGDPLLMDIANEDYHLQDGSPCINAGAIPLATLDYEGNMIPNSALADIGIYESQSTLAIDNTSPLKAKKVDSGVLLEWYTTSTNLDGYWEIERSPLSTKWEKLSSIALENSNRTNNIHQYIDRNPLLGMSFYRLKHINSRGQVSFSNTVSIYIDRIGIHIYPNPTCDLANIEFQSFANRIITLKAMGGKILSQQHTRAIRTTIDMGSYPNGIYFLDIWNKQELYTQKIIKNAMSK